MKIASYLIIGYNRENDTSGQMTWSYGFLLKGVNENGCL